MKKNEGLSSTVDEREQEEVKATVSWPIFDGGKNISSVKRAKFKVKQKKLIFEDVSKSVDTETANAWTTYDSSRSVLDATEAQLKAAEIDLNINLSQRENFISEIKKLEIEKKENIQYLENTKKELEII